MEGMKHYLIHTNFNGTPEFHSYWADDEDHAIEQLDDSTDEYNVSQYITHIFVSDTEILNNESAKRYAAQLWESDEEKDRIHDKHCERQDFLTNLKVGDQVKWNDPELDISSGVYTIFDIETEDGTLSGFELEVVWLTNGFSEVQAYVKEIE
jgi:hypothetical protein